MGRMLNRKRGLRTVTKALVLASLVLLCGVSTAAAASYTNLSANQALELLQKNPEVFLLDVRTPEEFRQVRLQGANLIPIDQFLARQGEVPTNRPLLVYCAVGSRSSQVAGYLAGRGYPEVYNLVGGIWGWQLRRYPLLLEGPP